MLRSSILAFAAALAAPAVAQQTAPAAQQAQAPAQVPTPPGRPLPRATFISDMNNDFARLDSNRDGKATKEEIEAFQRANALRQILARNRAIFNELDRDRSGQLSPDEFAQFRAQPTAPNAAPMLQRFDTNRDGLITVVEFRAGTLANFDRLDTDKDGVVSASEMKAGGIIK